MYAFLLILGAVIAAAGVVLIGPGLPFGGRDYDASIVTPGAVAIVGGLILIGLALAVRVLGRIEKALAARPLHHPVLQEEAAAPAAEEPAAAAPARIPFPPKPVAEPAPPPAPAVATPRVLPEDAALERLREKFPTLVRLENAPVVEDADVSLSPKPSVRADEAVAEANNAVAQQTNGAAPQGSSRGLRFRRVRRTGRSGRRTLKPFGRKSSGRDKKRRRLPQNNLRCRPTTAGAPRSSRY